MQGGYSQPYYGYTHLAILTLTIQDGYLETTDELSKQGVASEWPALCVACTLTVHHTCTPSIHCTHCTTSYPLPPLAAAPLAPIAPTAPTAGRMSPLRTLPVHPACAPYLSPPCAPELCTHCMTTACHLHPVHPNCAP